MTPSKDNSASVVPAPIKSVEKTLPLFERLIQSLAHGDKFLKEELRQQAVLGILTALQRNDPSKGEWQHLAARYARGSILNGYRDWKRSRREVPVLFFDNGAEGLIADEFQRTGRGLVVEDEGVVERILASVDCEFIRTCAPNVLTTREWKVIDLIYFGGLETSKISSELGISVPRVSQLHGSALSKLQKHLGVQTGSLN